MTLTWKTLTPWRCAFCGQPVELDGEVAEKHSAEEYPSKTLCFGSGVRPVK